MGVPEAEIEATLSALGEKTDDAGKFSIEPENRDTVRLYLGLETQWRIETVVLQKMVLTRRHGIEYGAVPIVARGLHIRLTESVWSGLQLMESEALTIYTRQETEALQRP
jgi:hypothetical protein